MHNDVYKSYFANILKNTECSVLYMEVLFDLIMLNYVSV